MSFFDKLFNRSRKMEEIPGTKKSEQCETVPPYLTQTVVFGMHRYRTAEEDSTVYLVNERLGIRKKLVDSLGNIQNFPGIIKEDFWLEEVSANSLKPQIRFRSSFEPRENGWIFEWQIQPDGRYWEDEDGFGAEKDLEVVLYTFVDHRGEFSGPFRLYKLGSVGYSMDRFTGNHACSQKEMLENTKGEETYVICPGNVFPQLLGAKVNYQSDRFYQLHGKEEALAYWSDPILSRDLKILAQALLDSSKSMWGMVGKASDRVKGCMTLFYVLTGEPVFKQVLDKFFAGEVDEYTVKKLSEK